MNPRDYAYDVETPVNCFTMVLKHIETGQTWYYEISHWRNDAPELVAMIHSLKAVGARMVGFNSINFDYPVIHFIVEAFLRQGFVTPEQIHEKAMSIIYSGDRWSHQIRPWQQIVDQLDLFLIHHFDNVSKTTSLKALQFNMRSPTIGDLPFDPNQPVGPEMRRPIFLYNEDDVDDTIRFYHHTWSMIEFREQLSAKHGQDFTNYNDTKIGKQFFIMELERRIPGVTKDGKGPRQTWRSSIRLSDIIFPYIAFQHPEFDRVLTYLKTVEITNTKSAPELKGVSAIIRGFQFDFGLGGIHGSLSDRTVREDADHEIVDIDVASYYPNIAIANRVFPQHLTEAFCDIYRDLFEQRKTYPKKSVESAMLKLALNGVYGASGDSYSPFLDTAYTMAITVNGQLLLCMLAEWLLDDPDFVPIQINTDGMTLRIPRAKRPFLDAICKRWEAFTLMTLEFTSYRAMFIRDVNNYLAVSTDGKVKRKGAYQHDTSEPNNIAVSLGWSQDWSALVVQKAVEAVCVHGADLCQFIYDHDDPFDFMIRAKVSASGKSRLVAVDPAQTDLFGRSITGPSDRPLQAVVRYIIARSGPHLFKVMPPLKVGAPDRRIAVDKGWPIHLCINVADFDWSALDRSYYVQQAEKLLKVLQ